MADASLSPERLLAEVEDVLRTMPPRPTIRHETEENLTWLGRAASVIECWNPSKAAAFDRHLSKFHSKMAIESTEGLRQILVMLHQAQSDLRLRTLGPLNIAVGQGRVYDYFEEIRKIVELATEEVFFVDAYLDADVVTRYLSQVRDGVAIRLLAGDRRKLATLLPAVDLFVQQSRQTVKVRSTAGLHDRFLFIDRTSCYLSGTSFKDGTRNAGTVITQITDAFKTMWETYEKMWAAATKERE